MIRLLLIQLGLSILLLVCCCIRSDAQNIKLSIPLHLDIGLTFSQFEREQGVDIVQMPGLALELQSGLAIRYKEKIGVNLEAGYFLNTFIYKAANSEYNISQYDPRIKASIYYLSKEINEHGSRLHIGLGWGMTYYAGDVLNKSTEDFTAKTYTLEFKSMLLSPEIGLTQVYENSSMDLLISYNQQIDGAVGMITDFTTPSGTAVAKSRNNHLALRIRYYFGLKKPKRKPAPISNKPNSEVLADFQSRRMNKSNTFESSKRRVKLKIWDNADEDGDIISISNNGVFVLTNYEIKNKKKSVIIDLAPGENEIVVYAHNEGLVPPNTASSVLVVGMKKHPITITTSLNRNQSVSIIRK